MKKTLTIVALVFVIITFCGCNNQASNDEDNTLKSQDEVNTSFENDASSIEISETADNATASLTDFMLNPYGYADAEYVVFMKNNPVDILVNVNIDSSDYQGLSEAIENGIRIWEEEIDYAITELFKDMQDENLQNKLLENPKTWETLAKEEFAFDEELIYSNKLGGYAVDFGLSYRYMLLCRSRALHIKYLHYMLECSISDRNEEQYLSLKFKNA